MNESEKPLPKQSARRTGIRILFAVLTIWAGIIALGTLWRPEGFEVENSMDIRRSLFVLGTMGTFLGVWWLALKSRSNDS